MTIFVTLPDEEATRLLGGLIAHHLLPGDVVLLGGGLGAGKTTLTKGLVHALGGTVEATSPTFALCHLYDTVPVVAHVDCWRMQEPRELEDLALEEVLDDGGVAVIEWGERASFLYGPIALVVVLARKDDQRIATIESTDDRWQERLSSIAVESDHLRDSR